MLEEIRRIMSADVQRHALVLKVLAFHMAWMTCAAAALAAGFYLAKQVMGLPAFPGIIVAVFAAGLVYWFLWAALRIIIRRLDPEDTLELFND